MASDSYSELVVGKVELKLTDFMEKLGAAQAEIDAIAASPGVEEKGPGFVEAGIAIVDAAMDQMQDWVNEVMKESRRQVPKDTEVLVRSARPNEGGGASADAPGVGEPKLEPDKRIVVEFGYGYGFEQNPKTGNFADQYALPVHEIWEAKHDPPTKNKYLEDPMIEKAGELGFEIKMRIQERLLKGLRISDNVFLFRRGGGPGIRAVFGPEGIVKRRRG